MAKYIWLSFPLALDGPRPPAIPAPKLTDLYTVEKDGANVQTLEVASHTGTHVDAPRHVTTDGVCICEFTPGELIFTRPVVIDLSLRDAEIVTSKHLRPDLPLMLKAGVVLFRFGYGEIRKTDPERYSTQCPGFGVEGARWLYENCPDLKAVGMDVPSLACIAHIEETMASHNELLGQEGSRFLVIEDMDLDKDLSNLKEIRLNPWLVRKMDSGPCSVIGVSE